MEDLYAVIIIEHGSTRRRKFSRVTKRKAYWCLDTKAGANRSTPNARPPRRSRGPLLRALAIEERALGPILLLTAYQLSQRRQCDAQLRAGGEELAACTDAPAEPNLTCSPRMPASICAARRTGCRPLRRDYETHQWRWLSQRGVEARHGKATGIVMPHEAILRIRSCIDRY